MAERLTKYEVLSLNDAALLRLCERQVCRGTGPGGQKRNKTSSAVRIVHLASGISVCDDVSRSQHQNQSHALAKLRVMLAAQLPPEPPPAGMVLPAVETPPNGRSPSFPLWVARLFDALAQAGQEHHAAAESLGCSPSKLLKLLSHDASLWQLYCAARQRAGLPALRAP